jgi:uncharacterized membrane protein
MSDPPPPGEARFTEADLAPEPADRPRFRPIVDRAACGVAVLAAGIWIGGMIALGACAAPFVFRLTPAPFSGDAMGAAFARFDRIAIGASVLLLGAEVVRTWVAGPTGRGLAARARRLTAVLMAAAAAYIGLVLTPQINEKHRAGVSRHVGPEGEALEAIHKRAESLGKAEVALGALLIGLHVFTVSDRRRREDDDEEGAVAPVPPGPSA